MRQVFFLRETCLFIRIPVICTPHFAVYFVENFFNTLWNPETFSKSTGQNLRNCSEKNEKKVQINY